MQASKKRVNVRTLVLVGIMSALVFVLSKAEIPIPIGGMDNTRIHFGNIMCLLSGILFGPMVGGLAAGFGSMAYDLTNPLYISEFWITFITKFVMGYVAGIISIKLRNGQNGTTPEKANMQQRMKSGFWIFAAAFSGQAVYIILYLTKTVIMQHFVYGIPWEGVWVVAATKGMVSGVNGILAVLSCVLLVPPLHAAISASGLFKQHIYRG